MEIQISKSFLNGYEKINKNIIKKKTFDILIDDKIISKNLIFSDIKWIETDDEYQGLYIESINHIVQFCQKLNHNGTTKSRNTYLRQSFIPVYNLSKIKKAKMSISANPLDEKNFSRILPNSIQIHIRESLTLNVEINDSLQKKLEKKLNPFKNLDEYVLFKTQSKEKNKGNKSTVIKYIFDEKKIVVYGKTDGANGMETLIIMEIIYKFNKNLEFFDITSKPNIKINEKIIKIGINIINLTPNINLFDKKDNEEEKIKRNQPLFYGNIIKKYIDSEVNIDKCFACDYKITENLINSHIHRFADINKEFMEGNLTRQEAEILVNSGDNGFLLCPNQDKEFEKGLIYFDIQTGTFLSNEDKILNNENYAYIKNKIMENFSSKKIKLSDEFINNIKKHHKRIGK